MNQSALQRSRDRLIERALDLERQDAEKSLGLVERVLEPFPNDIDARLIQARLWVRMGRAEAAYRQLERLVEIAPDRIDVRLSWVGVLFCLGRYSEGFDPLIATVALCDGESTVVNGTMERPLRSLWQSYMEFPKR